MRVKKHKSKILICMILLFVSSVFSSFSVKAENASDFTVIIDRTYVEYREPVKYLVWKLGNFENPHKLDMLSNTKVSEILGEPVIVSEDPSYRTIIVLRGAGNYYIRQEYPQSDRENIIPIVVELPYENQNSLTVYPKSLPDDRFTSLKIKKTDDNDNILKGVTFELLRYTSNGLKNVTTDENYDASKEGNNISFVTNEKGEILITGLIYGDYILRETKALEGYVLEEKDIKINLNSQEVRRITVINKKSPQTGEKKFLKVSSTDSNLRLAGAKFKVFKIVDGKYEAVIINGNDYIIESDVNGEFKAENLPFGTYALWEIEAPSNYSLLEDKIEFSIDSNEPIVQEIIIKNKPKGIPIIPDTGDVFMYMIFTTGILFILTGLFIHRREKVNK